MISKIEKQREEQLQKQPTYIWPISMSTVNVLEEPGKYQLGWHDAVLMLGEPEYDSYKGVQEVYLFDLGTPINGRLLRQRTIRIVDLIKGKDGLCSIVLNQERAPLYTQSLADRLVVVSKQDMESLFEE